MKFLVFPTREAAERFKDSAGQLIRERKVKSVFRVGRWPNRQPTRKGQLVFHQIGESGPLIFQLTHDIELLLRAHHPEHLAYLRPELPEQAKGPRRDPDDPGPMRADKELSDD